MSLSCIEEDVSGHVEMTEQSVCDDLKPSNVQLFLLLFYLFLAPNIDCLMQSRPSVNNSEVTEGSVPVGTV